MRSDLLAQALNQAGIVGLQFQESQLLPRKGGADTAECIPEQEGMNTNADLIDKVFPKGLADQFHPSATNE